MALLWCRSGFSHCCVFVEVLASGMLGAVLGLLCSNRPVSSRSLLLQLSVSTCVCFAQLACQDFWLCRSPTDDYPRWQINGLSLPTWQRNASYRGKRRCLFVCMCVRGCANVCKSSEETNDPFSHEANHCYDLPKTALRLMPTSDSSAVPTAQQRR